MTFSDFIHVAVGTLGELRCFSQPDDMLNATPLNPVVVRLHDSGGNFCMRKTVCRCNGQSQRDQAC